MRIVSPLAPRRQLTIPLAAALAGLDGAVIGLVDNGKPGATALLQGMQRGLEAAGCGFVLKRKPHPATLSPFIQELAKGCQAVVIAVGDGGAGTSWSIQDLVTLEQLGIPSVLLVLEGCLEWAATEAASAGCASPRLAMVAGPLEFLDPAEVVRRGESAVPLVRHALLAATP